MLLSTVSFFLILFEIFVLYSTSTLNRLFQSVSQELFVIPGHLLQGGLLRHNMAQLLRWSLHRNQQQQLPFLFCSKTSRLQETLMEKNIYIFTVFSLKWPPGWFYGSYKNINVMYSFVCSAFFLHWRGENSGQSRWQPKHSHVPSRPVPPPQTLSSVPTIGDCTVWFEENFFTVKVWRDSGEIISLICAGLSVA